MDSADLFYSWLICVGLRYLSTKITRPMKLCSEVFLVRLLVNQRRIRKRSSMLLASKRRIFRPSSDESQPANLHHQRRANAQRKMARSLRKASPSAHEWTMLPRAHENVIWAILGVYACISRFISTGF